MEKLLEVQRSVVSKYESQPLYNRDIYNQIKLENFCTGIVGQRGVGKTTLLLKFAIDHGLHDGKSMYVSADHIHFVNQQLYDLVDELVKTTEVRLLCVDEIHKHPNWQQQLKSISDTFGDFKILFTGSSMIDIVRGKYDLSRRVTLHQLHGFSFREYLNFRYGKDFASFSLEEIVEKHDSILESFSLEKPLMHFKQYLAHGYYPFFKLLESDFYYQQAISNTIQKTLYEDIATCHSLKTPTLLVLENILKFTVSSSPGEITPAKLANLLSKDFQSVSEYTKMLEQAGLLNHLYTHKTGKAQVKNPIKMYPENTNMIYALDVPQVEDSLLGRLRETFVVNQIRNAGYPIFYSESGDFDVQGMTLEVGGANKTQKQIKGVKNAYVVSDNIERGFGRKIPLYLLGFLY